MGGLQQVNVEAGTFGLLPGHLIAEPGCHGRHTFISHALAGGRTLAEVRDAAGQIGRLNPATHRQVENSIPIASNITTTDSPITPPGISRS